MCGRRVAARALAKHRPLLTVIRWSDGSESYQLSSSRWCDGSPAGEELAAAFDDLRLPVRQLGDVWDQVAGLWVDGRPTEASVLARKALDALAVVGIRPRKLDPKRSKHGSQ